ncbi:pilus assembly protein PilP [Alkalimonas sp. NCh-2]|uniref:pilus assembly protein PilP n=1 Tax=Alkalimonas sp. NCh-2 TaxID=3144846 RepID=UPI0031F63D7C
MRWIGLVPLMLLLTACFNDMADIHEFEAEVKANTRTRVEPLPEMKEFRHIAYQGSQARSPFAMPRREALQERFVQVQDCPHPDPNRSREPLESFALDNLVMRGTLGDSSQLWALIQAGDQTLHRITVNHHLGLHHGRVLSVTPAQIELLELIPDGTGCWQERTTILQMAGSAH